MKTVGVSREKSGGYREMAMKHAKTLENQHLGRLEMNQSMPQ